MQRGLQPPKDLPVIGIGRTMISINAAMLNLLAGARQLELSAEDGKPVLTPSKKGYAVILNTSKLSGFIWARVSGVFGEGSRWVMTWDPVKRRFTGERWSEDFTLPEYVTVRRDELEQLRRVAGERSGWRPI